MLLLNCENFIYKGNISTTGPVFVQTMKFIRSAADTVCNSAEMSFSRYANANLYPDDTVNILHNESYIKKRNFPWSVCFYIGPE